MACKAVSSGKRLLVSHAGQTRAVEVHAVGVGGAGEAVMRVYQVGHAPGERGGWMMIRVADIRAMTLSDEPSGAPRDGYRRDDGAMQTILCQV